MIYRLFSQVKIHLKMFWWREREADSKTRKEGDRKREEEKRREREKKREAH